MNSCLRLLVFVALAAACLPHLGGAQAQDRNRACRMEWRQDGRTLASPDTFATETKGPSQKEFANGPHHPRTHRSLRNFDYGLVVMVGLFPRLQPEGSRSALVRINNPA